MTIALKAQGEAVAVAAPALVGVHVPALDGVRGLAIVLVMAHHFFFTVRFDSAGVNRVFDIARSGWIGVDLFFVLSGFLITGILWDGRGKRTADGRGRALARFYGRRALRIFPLYFAVLIGAALLGAWVMPAADPHNAALRGNFPWLFGYLQNYVMDARGDFRAFEGTHVNFAHFWSLAVEEHFYLVWPVLVPALSRAALLRACGVGIAVSIGWKLAIAAGGSGDLIGVYTLTQCRMDSLLIGAWLALAARGPAGLGVVLREARLIVALGFPVLIGAILLQGDLPRRVTPAGVLIYPALAVLFAALVCVVLAADGAWRRVFESRVLRFFGAYSYGLYVFHGCLEKLFAPWREADALIALNRWPAGKSLVVAAMWFAASLGLALLSRRLLEEPFLKLKRWC